jgi:hypothetical protein
MNAFPRVRSWRPLALLLASAAMLAGCAVLTVDVDVYKGPLANHEESQVQQLAALVSGAKPLLHQLEQQLRAAGTEECRRKADYVAAISELYDRRERQTEVSDIYAAYFAKGETAYRAWEAEVKLQTRLERSLAQKRAGDLRKNGNEHRETYLATTFRAENVEQQYAHSYVQGRERLKELFETALEVLRVLALEKAKIEEALKSSDPEVREVAKKAEEKRRERLEVTKNLLLMLTKKGNDRVEAWAYGNTLRPAKPTRLQVAEELGEKIEADPAVAAQALDKIHRELGGFGLVLSRFDDEEALALETVQAAFDAARRALGGGLATGRLDEGIDELVEAALDRIHRDRYHGDRPSNECAEVRQLRSSLVNFAAKILFIADYERLLSEPPATSTGITPNRRPGTGSGATDTAPATAHAGISPQTLADKMLLLQAIGHSILALTDELEHGQQWLKNELRRKDAELHYAQGVILGEGVLWLRAWRAEAERKYREAKEPETTAWKNIADTLAELYQAALADPDRLPLGWPAAFEQLKGSFTAESKEAGYLKELTPPAAGLPPYDPKESSSVQSRSDVADTLLTALYYQRIKASAAGNDTRAIDEAIRAASARKAQTVRLRPAGAILRTASTIPSLQANASVLSSRNVLVELFKQALPVSFGASRLKKRRAEMSEELDRASWQPINQIKVQGTGETNYVLVKDDIGNWYVRNYSADPEKALKSLGNFLNSYYLPAKGVAAAAAEATQTAQENTAQSAAGIDDLKASDEADAGEHVGAVKTLSDALKAVPGKEFGEPKKKFSEDEKTKAASERFSAKIAAVDAAKDVAPGKKARSLLEAADRFLAEVDEVPARTELRKLLKAPADAYFKTRGEHLSARKAALQKQLFDSIP